MTVIDRHGRLRLLITHVVPIDGRGVTIGKVVTGPKKQKEIWINCKLSNLLPNVHSQVFCIGDGQTLVGS